MSGEEDNSARKKKRRSSGVWDHYTEINNKAVCDYCSYSCPIPKSSSTGNLWKHTRTRHFTMTGNATVSRIIIFQ